MALDKSVLSTLMQSKIAAIANITNTAELAKFCDAIADAVVSHIKAAAQVTTSTPGAQAGGSTLPGTGTIS